MVRVPKLGKNGKQRLKSIHLILSVVWLGAGVSMMMLRFAWVPSQSADLYALNYAASIIDNLIIIPVAWGALITGLLGSWLTNWGFFKYRWVTVKLVLTTALMIYAPLFQSKWASKMEEISRVEGLQALQNPVYLHYQTMYSYSGLAIITTLAFLAVISTLKPWMRQDRASTTPSVTRGDGGRAGEQAAG